MGNSRDRIGQDAGRRRETREEFRVKTTRVCTGQNAPTTFSVPTVDNRHHCRWIATARPKFVRVSPYIIKPPFPSDGGFAAASAGRSGPPAPLEPDARLVVYDALRSGPEHAGSSYDPSRDLDDRCIQKQPSILFGCSLRAL